MRLIGFEADDRPVFDVALPHGADPRVTVWDQGWSLLRPLQADRDETGELTLRLLVGPRASSKRPRVSGRGRDHDLQLADGEEPIVRQRVAAYALVHSTRGLLATQFSGKTAVQSRWGLPGGGIDDGEQPRAAVLREIGEETSQVVELGDLVAVQTSHWVGRSPRGVAEDFHAVRLVYSADCADPSDPVVRDVDGTTAQARWVPVAQWRDLDWTVGWRDVLKPLLA